MAEADVEGLLAEGEVGVAAGSFCAAAVETEMVADFGLGEVVSTPAGEGAMFEIGEICIVLSSV